MPHVANTVRSLSVAAPAVELGGEGGDELESRFGRACECAWVLVSALGLDQDGGGTGFAEVSE